MRENEQKLFSADYVLLMTSTMGISFVTYFFFSSLSLFAETLTGTVAFAGYMSLAYSATALLTRPLSGILSDRKGRVKTLVFGAALSTVSCVLYSFATGLAMYNLMLGLVLLIAIRVVNGVGMGFNMTSAGAAVADIVPKERLAEGIGLYGIAGTIAQAVGPLIALAIVGNGELSNFHTLFYVSTAFCGVSLICGCFIKYERMRKKEQALKTEQPEYDAGITARKSDAVSGTPGSELIEQNGQAEPVEPEEKTFLGFDRSMLGPAVVTLVYFFGISSIMTFMTLYGKNLGFQVGYLGWFFFASAAGVLLSRVFFGRIADRRGADVIIIPGFVLIVACLVAISFISSLPVFILLGLPYGIASGAIGPNINALMFKRCSPKRRGTVAAAYSMAIDVGITLGAPILGWVADLSGFRLVYLLSAALAAIALVIYIFYVSDKRRIRV